VNKQGRAVRGISPTRGPQTGSPAGVGAVREGSAKTNASFSARLFREIAGGMCRQLIRQARLRSQARFDLVGFARVAEINSIYISRVASRF